MIKLLAYPILKGGDGQLKTGMFIEIARWDNDAFHDKFDIFDEADWGKFIGNYRRSGKRLSEFDPFGNQYAYAIRIVSADRLMKEFFDLPLQHFKHCYLFPQEVSMRDRTRLLVAKNKEFVYPYLRKND